MYPNISTHSSIRLTLRSFGMNIGSSLILPKSDSSERMLTLSKSFFGISILFKIVLAPSENTFVVGTFSCFRFKFDSFDPNTVVVCALNSRFKFRVRIKNAMIKITQRTPKTTDTTIKTIRRVAAASVSSVADLSIGTS